MDFQITALFAAFGGGLFASAIGTLPSFIFTGLAVMAGVAVAAAGGGDVVLAGVAFGPFLGPHIAFAGGVGATAYAARRNLMPNGRDIAAGLMGLNRPDVLFMGGLFGAGGYAIERGLAALGLVPWTDTIALTVFLSAVAARLAFGETGVLGRVAAGGARFTPSDDAHWVRWQEKPGQILAIGIGAGIASGYAALLLGADRGGAVIGFGIAAAALIFLQYGTQMPVTHHIALPAALAALASSSLAVGVVFGVIGGFLAELFSRLFLIHGDTHIDPPATAIAVAVALLRLCQAAHLI